MQQVVLRSPSGDLGADVEEFLESRGSSTAYSYRTTFQKYFIPFLSTFEHRGIVISDMTELLDLVSEDQAKPKREKTFLARAVMRKFKDHLVSCGLSINSVHSRLAAVQSFGKYFDVPFSSKDIDLDKAIAQTKSFDWSIGFFEDFNALLEHPKYRALHSFMFQSGLAISDVLCRLYGEIAEAYQVEVNHLVKGEPVEPICIPVVRGKTKVEHHVCVAQETIVLLKAYFDFECGEGKVPGVDERIFGLKRRAVNEVFCNRAKALLGEWPYRNPASPHSLRKFFRKQLVKEGGCPPEYAEYFMGHTLRSNGLSMAATYSNQMSTSDWREIYQKYTSQLAFQIKNPETVKKQLKKQNKTR